MQVLALLSRLERKLARTRGVAKDQRCSKMTSLPTADSRAAKIRSVSYMRDAYEPKLRSCEIEVLADTGEPDVRIGSISEVRVRDQEVRFALMTRHCQPGLSGLKSAKYGSLRLFQEHGKWCKPQPASCQWDEPKFCKLTAAPVPSAGEHCNSFDIGLRALGRGGFSHRNPFRRTTAHGQNLEPKE
jgi:hypothetical protein